MTIRILPSQKLTELRCQDPAVQKFANQELRKHVSDVFEQFRVMVITSRLPGYTVATLPGGIIGDTAHVTDALAPIFGSAVVGGGAVMVPVYYTGSAWFVG